MMANISFRSDKSWIFTLHIKQMLYKWLKTIKVKRNRKRNQFVSFFNIHWTCKCIQNLSLI
jgi:hypothetical protein